MKEENGMKVELEKPLVWRADKIGYLKWVTTLVGQWNKASRQ